MSRFVSLIAAAAAVVNVVLAGPAASPSHATLLVGTGVDYVSGPMNQSTRDVMGFLVASSNGRDLTLAAARYDHSDLGPGIIGSAGIGFPVSRAVSLQLSGARTVGDEMYRAWLIQTGPLFAIGGGRTLGILYTRSGNNLNPSATGLTSEVGIPLAPNFNALARGSVASVEGGGTSLQGSVGMNWGLARRWLVLAELGAGRDVTSLAQGAAPSQPGILGDTGIGTSPSSQIGGWGYVSGTALQIGVRYIIH